MKCVVKNLDNQETGFIELDPEIFGLPVRPDILQRAIRWQLNKAQTGNHKTKGISEISGTTRKPYKQKGTGQARQGSLRATQFRGGATVFGPVVRSHAHKLNKKFRKLAVKTALSTKFQESRICILETFSDSMYKTSTLMKQFKGLGISSALVVCSPTLSPEVTRGFHNLQGIDVLPAHAANVYDILKKESLIISRDALSYLVDRLK